MESFASWKFRDQIHNTISFGNLNIQAVRVAATSNHYSLIVFPLRRNQTCNPLKTMIPATNMAEITEKPLIYLGLSESGNSYHIRS